MMVFKVSAMLRAPATGSGSGKSIDDELTAGYMEPNQAAWSNSLDLRVIWKMNVRQPIARFEKRLPNDLRLVVFKKSRRDRFLIVVELLGLRTGSGFKIHQTQSLHVLNTSLHWRDRALARCGL